MSRISPGPLGVSCQPKKCDSYSLLCGSVTARSQDRMHLELTLLHVDVGLHSVKGVFDTTHLSNKLCFMYDVTASQIPN